MQPSGSPFGMFGNKEGVLRELCVMAYTLPATVCVFIGERGIDGEMRIFRGKRSGFHHRNSQ